MNTRLLVKRCYIAVKIKFWYNSKKGVVEFLNSSHFKFLLKLLNSINHDTLKIFKLILNNL